MAVDWNLSRTNRPVLVNVLLAIFFSPLLIFLVIRNVFTPLVATLLSVLTAGTLGATLCNLRGVFSQCRDRKGQFPPHLIIPYYVRPLTGMVTGLLSFFIGNLLVTSLSIDAATQGWTTLEGRLPYIGFAILAGFAAQEFMERMKEVARTLFSERLQENEYSQLEKLAELHKEGVLDEEEFKAKKREALSLVSLLESSEQQPRRETQKPETEEE
jgi:hypothetical protein